MKLGLLEYMEEVKRRSNSDPEYLELAKGNNDSYALVMEPEPDKGVAEQIAMGFTHVDGKMNEIWLGERETDFTISGAYGVWVDILRGKMGATKAIAMHKLKAQGPLMQLLQDSNRIVRWVEILRTIPTEFEGEYAEHDLPGE